MEEKLSELFLPSRSDNTSMSNDGRYLDEIFQKKIIIIANENSIYQHPWYS